MSERLRPLLEPESMAVIGASDHPGRIGGMAIAHSLKRGYRGRIFPINPKHRTVQGIECWPDVESLPAVPDLVVLAIAAADVTPMLRRCHRKGVPAALVYAAGFAESTDAEGAALQAELKAFAGESGMVVAGPNLMGFANLRSHAYTAFAAIFDTAPMQEAAGEVALVTQSGNICSALYALCRRQRVGISHFINTGNEACVEFAEYLQYLAEDDGTGTVLGYVEQLRDGDAFIRAAAEFAQRGKVLVIAKAGQSEKGAQAVRSHTSALAGDRRIYAAAFAQLGVIEADDLAQMVDLAALAAQRERTGGRRVAVVTISGAVGALLADQLTLRGVELPTLPGEVQQLLRGGIPGYGMVGNPVDVTGNIVNEPGFARVALEALARTDAVDAVVVAAPGYLLDRMADDLVAIAAAASRLIVALDTGEATCRDRLVASGVPVFDDLGRLARALPPYLLWCARRTGTVEWMVRRARPVAAAASPSLPCTERDAKRWLADLGVAVPPEHLARTRSAAVEIAIGIGFPIVLKISSASIAHKTEIGGVRLDLRNADQVGKAFDDVMAAARRAFPGVGDLAVSVQGMQRGLVELIVGATRDPVFDWCLTVGSGGVLAELHRDVAHRLWPVDTAEAAQMLQELRIWPLLTGWRAGPAADIAAACRAIAALSNGLAGCADEVDSVEVNPLLVKRSGEGAVALDALVLGSKRFEQGDEQ